MKALKIAKKIEAKGIIAQAYFQLGLLYKQKRINDKAIQFFSNAIQLFEETEAETFLNQARVSLESIQKQSQK